MLAAAPELRTPGFRRISTACSCGAPAAVYFFDPFRAYCVEHAPPPQRPDRA